MLKQKQQKRLLLKHKHLIHEEKQKEYPTRVFLVLFNGEVIGGLSNPIMIKNIVMWL